MMMTYLVPIPREGCQARHVVEKTCGMAYESPFFSVRDYIEYLELIEVESGCPPFKQTS